MYSSPLKAIEELVVNSYDADAAECRIGITAELSSALSSITTTKTTLDLFAPKPEPQAAVSRSTIRASAVKSGEETEKKPRLEKASSAETASNFTDSSDELDQISSQAIVIFDDGSGMDYAGLEQLWHVGDSRKGEQDLSSRRNRKLIGKFGIGKLATYSIANRITYLSRRADKIFHVTCDFRDFKSNPQGGTETPVPLTVNEVDDPKVFRGEAGFETICKTVGLDANDLTNGKQPTWTLCILEDLKPKAAELKIGRLKWVLRTAMPLKSDFRVFVAGDQIERSKASFNPLVEFKVGEIDSDRLARLNRSLDPDWQWHVEGDGLVSQGFPAGVRGEILVTERSLVLGKSVDIDRSHGFFVYVRQRLVNQNDELFGLHALSHGTFNYFRADLHIDDLNTEVTAPREGLERSRKKSVAGDLLLALFNEARDRREKFDTDRARGEKQKRESERSYVPTRLVEQPIADTLSIFGGASSGSDADGGWFFIEEQDDSKLQEVVEQLYSEKRPKYRYTYGGLGKTERMVKFDPSSSQFTLNDDHEVVIAYSDDPRARSLLEDIVTSEVLLEVYLREAGVEPHVVGEVLERRDMLIRSLARDRVYSLDAIAQSLLDSSDDEHDLEIALVAATRALGFTAKHISKGGEPDGLARFNDFRSGEVKITLEAKSSTSIPSLSAIDFSGLAEHKKRHGAQGCLLVAPSYPGEQRRRKGEDEESELSAVEARATSDKISCWTIENLARVIRATETHQIGAAQIVDIVLNKFTPKDVALAVEGLFKQGTNRQTLYREALIALKTLNQGDRLANDRRTVQHVSALLSIKPETAHTGDADVRSALIEIGNASRGMLRVVDQTIVFNGDMDELERRVSSLTGQAGPPRKLGSFRAD